MLAGGGDSERIRRGSEEVWEIDSSSTVCDCACVHLMIPSLETILMSLNMRTQRTRKEETEYSAEIKRTHKDNARQTEKWHQPLQLVGGNELSLNQLLQACLQTGQEVLWTEFVRRSQPLIAGVIAKTVRSSNKADPDLVDDLVQETYVKLCFNNCMILRRFVPRHENALHGFLKVVASNTVRDHFRSIGNQKNGGRITEVPLEGIAELHLPKLSLAAFDGPDLLREIEKNLLKACSDGPNSIRDQIIFWLYYKYGVTTESISRLRSIGLSVKGVESTILRMARLLKLTMKGKRI